MRKVNNSRTKAINRLPLQLKITTVEMDLMKRISIQEEIVELKGLGLIMLRS